MLNKIYEKIIPENNIFCIKKCKEKSDFYKHFICFFSKKLCEYKAIKNSKNFINFLFDFFICSDIIPSGILDIKLY